MKKWIFLCLALVLVIIIAAISIGCKAKEEPKPAAKQEAKPPEAPTPPAPAETPAPAPFPQAQTEEEKQFMKVHEKEMTTFMEKCSGCHSLQRILAKKGSKEEWDEILKIMAGKPHANISEEELKGIQKWLDFMRAIP